MRFLTLCVTAFAFVASCNFSQASQLHVIAIAATDDDQLGKEFEANQKSVVKYVTALSKTTKLELRLHEVIGDHYLMNPLIFK